MTDEEDNAWLGTSCEKARPAAADPAAADLETARGAGSRSADPYGADLAVSVTGRLFRLAPRLMDLQELGARQYGLGAAEA